MSFQKIEPGIFQNFIKRSIIEGADITNEKEEVYIKLGNEVELQQNYIECSTQNDISCNEIKIIADKKQKTKNMLEEHRNAAKLEYISCDTALKSCKLLYNDLTNKTKEFTDTYTSINNLNEQISNCGGKKKECENIDVQLNILDKQLRKMENDLQNLVKKGRENKC